MEEEKKNDDQTPLRNLDKVMEDVGGFGRFQLLAYTVIAFGINSTGFWFYILGFLYQLPDYKCEVTPDHDAKIDDICTRENICAGDNRIRNWKVDEDSNRSLDNWRQKLELDMCIDVWKPSLIASAFFIGWCVTLLWVPGLADVFGRRRLFASAMAFGAVIYTVMMFTSSLNVMIGMSFLMGSLSSVRLNVGYIYLMELMPKSKHTAVASFWNITEGLIYVLASLYFWQISNYWLYFVAIGYGFAIYSAIAAWFLPESPHFLIEV